MWVEKTEPGTGRVNKRVKIGFIISLSALVLLMFSCRREDRDFRATQASQVANVVPDSQLHPGGPLPNGGQVNPGELTAATNLQNPFQGNAYAISEGQRLFTWYNCSGCHANGGGGIGPALNDSTWLYGGQPANIFESISKGRPNGMPAWGPKIPEYQIWQLVTFVQSLSGAEPRTATPGRPDSMANGTLQPKGAGNPR
ncbi:MAG TPA: c-type cytochrome [Blastocatellia bacterium]|nr:c-type cytochrome [Blastocatellia bacterium]